LKGGLEYLWGATLHNDPINDEYAQGKSYPFIDWWAHDTEQEKELVEAFIDWVYDRWQQYPILKCEFIIMRVMRSQRLKS